MDVHRTLVAWFESLRGASYYDVLRVAPTASADEIQHAFRALSQHCHPDVFAGDSDEVVQAAARVFVRLTEAYNTLRRPHVRVRYDEYLRTRSSADSHGDDDDASSSGAFDEFAVAPRPRYEQRSLVTIARTALSKKYAEKADRLLTNGNLELARVQMVSACQHDPDNEELRQRLQWIYEALALEPL